MLIHVAYFAKCKTVKISSDGILMAVLYIFVMLQVVSYYYPLRDNYLEVFSKQQFADS